MNIAQRIGLRFNGPTKHTSNLGVWYTIRLEAKQEVRKFAQCVGSYHVDKFPKLRLMLAKRKV